MQKPLRHSYGSDPACFGDLHRPAGTRRPGVVVIIHGGFWRAQYGLGLGTPLAQDLVTRGYTVWNLEYRRVGNGGGWPTTLQDVSDGIEALADLDVDTTQVVAIGHSAGGHLATWAAGRQLLSATAPGAAPRVALTAVIAQAGVLDLATSARRGVGGRAALDLMGGGPDELPDRYAEADPIGLLPLTVPVVCVHSRGDANVPFEQSVAYVAAATKAAGRAKLIEVFGDHMSLIDPTAADWRAVLDELPNLIR